MNDLQIPIQEIVRTLQPHVPAPKDPCPNLHKQKPPCPNLPTTKPPCPAPPLQRPTRLDIPPSPPVKQTRQVRRRKHGCSKGSCHSDRSDSGKSARKREKPSIKSPEVDACLELVKFSERAVEHPVGEAALWEDELKHKEIYPVGEAALWEDELELDSFSTIDLLQYTSSSATDLHDNGYRDNGYRDNGYRDNGYRDNSNSGKQKVLPSPPNVDTDVVGKFKDGIRRNHLYQVS